MANSSTAVKGISNWVYGRLLGSTSATRRYKVCPSHIKTQDFAGFCEKGSSILAHFYSMADYSTTVRGIPILLFGRKSGSASATHRYKVRLYAMNTHRTTGLAISDPRWLIPPQPLELFQFGLRETIGLDVSYTAV